MTAADGAQLDQHVEVLAASGPEGKWSYGSGYLLAPRLVLTARHVVPPALISVEVRRGIMADTWLQAQVVWAAEASGIDIALLEVTGLGLGIVRPPGIGRLRTPPGSVLRPRWRQDVSCTGYPQVQERWLAEGRPIRDTLTVTGTVREANARTGRITVGISGNYVAEGSAWRGISGAPLYFERRLVGVVTTTTSDGRTFDALPLGSLLGGEISPATSYREPPESIERFRQVLADHQVDMACPVTHRQPYKTTLRNVTSTHQPLRDRDAELHRLRQWITGDVPYAVWTGEPWSGKSAIAAAVAVDPPADVDVVCYFSEGGNPTSADDVLAKIADQVAALLDETRPPDPAAEFDDLLNRARIAQQSDGRQILLLIDGLDEIARRRELQRLLGSLPNSPTQGLSVLLFSRPSPDVTTLVSPDHALRRDQTRDDVILQPSPYAQQIRERATLDLDALYYEGGPAWRACECVAAVGRLTEADLGRALDMDPADRDRLRQALAGQPGGRILVPMPSTEPPLLWFAHENLREIVLARSATPPEDYRESMIRLGEQYATSGWPTTTPAFLVTEYPVMLASHGALAKLIATVTSPLWLEQHQRQTGALPGAADVLRRSLAAAGSVRLEEWPALIDVALRLSEVAPGLDDYPHDLILAFGLAGELQHAQLRAQQLTRPDRRAEALMALTEPLERIDRLQARTLLLLAAEAAAELTEDPPPEEPGAVVRLSARLGLSAYRIGQISLASSLNHSIATLIARSSDDLLPSVVLEAASLAVILGDQSHAKALMGGLTGQELSSDEQIRRRHLDDAIAGHSVFSPPAVHGRQALSTISSYAGSDPDRIYLGRIKAALERGDSRDAAHLLANFRSHPVRFLDHLTSWVDTVAEFAHGAALAHGSRAAVFAYAAEDYWRKNAQQSAEQNSALDLSVRGGGADLIRAVEEMWRHGRQREALDAVRLDGSPQRQALITGCFAVGMAGAGDVTTSKRLLAGTDRNVGLGVHEAIGQLWAQEGRWRDAVELVSDRSNFERDVVDATAVYEAIRSGAVDEGMELLRRCRYNPMIPFAPLAMAARAFAEIGYIDVATGIAAGIKDDARRLGVLVDVAAAMTPGDERDDPAAVLRQVLAETAHLNGGHKRVGIFADAAQVANQLELPEVASAALRLAVGAAFRTADAEERCAAVLLLAQHSAGRVLGARLCAKAARDARRAGPDAAVEVAEVAYNLDELELADRIVDSLLAEHVTGPNLTDLAIAAAKSRRVDKATRLLKAQAAGQTDAGALARAAAQAGLWDLAEEYAGRVPRRQRAGIFGDMAEVATTHDEAVARQMVTRGLLSGMSGRLLVAAIRLAPQAGPGAIKWLTQI
ncbi:hypothetical protein GCM10009557_00680 [Virgisporangium ochraceum]|uniref:Nephrocystin 3-like N-terminal domain-containing protein n=1 Tax=Virgisporangium ochraceum TaxID=65505 RepID=A0A8J4A5B3_9ACTN|nr:hypothetical protein Voc01_090170 [Virgisporangium ochraceum]